MSAHCGRQSALYKLQMTSRQVEYFSNEGCSSKMPEWADALLNVVRLAKGKLGDAVGDEALHVWAPGLRELNYTIQEDIAQHERRPGSRGRVKVPDAFNRDLGILVEIEGRAAADNIHRDLIMASLPIAGVDIKYLAVGVPILHARPVPKQIHLRRLFNEVKFLLERIYAPSSQLHLPLDGVLLFGY